MTDAHVHKLACLAEAIHSCGAHAEQLGDLANREQAFPRTPGGKLL